ncbi:ParB/RepB/Spo0J family partition protein [Magnetospirillum sulfuroxidans]|uniref:ParB N-terminal domain-containing protein n=1 Tax=Magnetospirillum sulfuroxidans TaxID=611300 RepID=A0ABS5I8R9_9PROT|nr:ParB N-terminal domain-containing protein [Magnetospirillum sulfuroxidans]MBR9970832.1 ParB N-terminal domain-containing protein [Magnetospirillum sulfuroxidans]
MTARVVTLADLMRQAGLSQDKLAKLATATGHKLNQSQVSGLLSGSLGFTLDSAKACAAVLAVPITTFLPELAALVPPSTTGDSRIKRFALDDLMLARGNERTSYDPAAIDDLATQIIDAGTLYQNLVGYPEDAHKTAKVAVWDGGRRWRALHRAREWGALPAGLQEFGIPVLLLEDRVACMKATIAANQKEDTHFLDRGAALSRLQDETGWMAPRLARETGIGSERLVQQLLQIHRDLPDWAKDRAYLPKDDPQHLKFRDCRDMVEKSRRAAPGAPVNAPPEQEKGEVAETPLPLELQRLAAPIAAPPATATAPVKFTKEQVAEGLKTFLTSQRGSEPPVADGVIRIVTGRSELIGIGRDTLLSDALSKNGMVAAAADLAEEFGIIFLADDVASAKTVAGLVRAVINAPKDTGTARPSPPPEDHRPAAVGGRIGQHWVLHAVQRTLGDRPTLIELKHDESGQIIQFVPAQRDIEGD